MTFAVATPAAQFGSNASAATITFTGFGATIPVGSLLVFDWDENVASLTVTSVADNSAQAGVANAYSINTPLSGTTLSFGTVYCWVTRSILATDTITITLSAAGTRRGGTLRCWTLANGVPVLDRVASVTADTTSPVTLASTGTLNASDELAVAMRGWLGGAVASGYAHTTPAGFTNATSGLSAGTSTRVEANMSFDDNLASSTAFADDATYTSITRAHGQVLTFRDVVSPSAPSVTILDSFNAGATQLLTARAGWSATGFHSAGNISWRTDAVPTVADNTNTPTTAHSNMWATQFAADQYAGFTYGAGGTPDDIQIITRGAALSGSGTTGYEMYVRWNGEIRLQRDGTVLARVQTPTPAAGDSFCCQAIGNILYAWVRRSGGSWVLMLAVTDTTYAGAGYIGFEQVASGTATVTEFFGGAVGAAVFPVSCAATQAQSAEQARSVGHSSPATQSQLSASVRTIAHQSAATQTQVAALKRTIARASPATQAQLAATVVSRTVRVTIAATQGQLAGPLIRGLLPDDPLLDPDFLVSPDGVPMILRTVNHISAATQAQSAAQRRTAGRSCSATQGQAAAYLRGVAHTSATTQPQVVVASRSLPRLISTTQAQAAAQSRSVGRRPAATQPQAVVLLRSVSHTSPATQAQLAAQRRTANRIIVVTQAQLADAVKIKAVSILVTATQPQLAAQRRSAGRISPATQAQAAAVLRSASHTCAATQAQLASQRRTANRVIAATQAQAADVVKVKAVLILAAATQAQAASVKRNAARISATTQAQAATVSRSVPRAASCTQPQVAASTRGVNHRSSATQPQTAASARSLSRVIAATQPQAAVVKRNATRSCSATQPQLVLVTRQVPRSAATTQAQAAAQRRTANRVISTTQPQAASCTALRTGTSVIVTATQAQVAAVRRIAGRRSTATQAQLAAVTFTVQRNAYPVITSVIVCEDPRAGTMDCPAPEAGPVYSDAPNGGVSSNPSPGEVG